MRNENVMTQNDEMMFETYGVGCRTHNEKVTHEMYGTTTEITPGQFRYYECALKANYLCWAMTALDNAWSPNAIVWPSRDMDKITSYYRTIADRNGITLPDPHVIPAEQRPAVSHQAGRDYHRCCSALGALYYDLLD